MLPVSTVSIKAVHSPCSTSAQAWPQVTAEKGHGRNVAPTWAWSPAGTAGSCGRHWTGSTGHRFPDALSGDPRQLPPPSDPPAKPGAGAEAELHSLSISPHLPSICSMRGGGAPHQNPAAIPPGAVLLGVSWGNKAQRMGLQSPHFRWCWGPRWIPAAAGSCEA